MTPPQNKPKMKVIAPVPRGRQHPSGTEAIRSRPNVTDGGHLGLSLQYPTIVDTRANFQDLMPVSL